MKNIAAYTYTWPANFPPYLSINRQPDASVAVTVRGHDCTTATIAVPEFAWRQIVRDAVRELDVWANER